MALIDEADQKLIKLAFPDQNNSPVTKLIDLDKEEREIKPTVSWKDIARSLGPKPQSEAAPVINQWDQEQLFKPRVLSSSPDYVLCKHCKRPTLVQVLAHHVEACIPRQAQEKARAKVKAQAKAKVGSDEIDESDRTLNEEEGFSMQDSPSKPASATPSNMSSMPNRKRKKDDSTIEDGGSNTPTSTKKAKASKNNSLNGNSAVANGVPNGSVKNKPGRKKKDKSAEIAALKEKRLQEKNKPVDVEKQCGVPLANGQLCARSLTCKSHSMGAKRAVMGRSASYDVLLAQYQRRNQVKMASKSTTQQIADDNEALASSVALNPDEEVRQVMEGVRRSTYVPLDQPVITGSYSKKHFFCMREMLASALLPQNQGLGGIFGRAAAFQVDNPSTLHFVRPIARTTPVNNARR